MLRTDFSTRAPCVVWAEKYFPSNCTVSIPIWIKISAPSSVVIPIAWLVGNKAETVPDTGETNLPSDGSIATPFPVQITEMVNTILNIVKYHFKMELDENSVNYERFLTHLRFFAVRFVRKEKLDESVDQFFFEQIQLKYPDAYACAKKSPLI